MPPAPDPLVLQVHLGQVGATETPEQRPRAKRGWKHSWKAQQKESSHARRKEERTRSQMSAGSATGLQGMPAQVWLAKVKKYP